MTFRERLARWLYPSAFVRKAPVSRQRRASAPVAPVVEEEPSEFQAPLHPVVAEQAPVEKLPDEYEALISMEWGNMPVAATLTRARVRAMVKENVRRGDIAQAIYGQVTEIE